MNQSFIKIEDQGVGPCLLPITKGCEIWSFHRWKFIILLLMIRLIRHLSTCHSISVFKVELLLIGVFQSAGGLVHLHLDSIVLHERLLPDYQSLGVPFK